MYESLHFWLIFASNLNTALNLITDDGFGTSTDFVIAVDQEETSPAYILYDIYNPAKVRGGKLNVTLYGTWSEKHGLNVILTMPKYKRRANLNKMKLSIGSVASIT